MLSLCLTALRRFMCTDRRHHYKTPSYALQSHNHNHTLQCHLAKPQSHTPVSPCKATITHSSVALQRHNHTLQCRLAKPQSHTPVSPCKATITHSSVALQSHNHTLQCRPRLSDCSQAQCDWSNSDQLPCMMTYLYLRENASKYFSSDSSKP